MAKWNKTGRTHSIDSLAPGLTEFLPGAFFIPAIYVNTASRDIVILYCGELVLEGQLIFSRDPLITWDIS